MDLGLKDKVVVVTGSARGIGKATALAFAEEGAKVVVGDILDEGAKVAEEIQTRGTDSLFVKFDFTKLAEARRLAEETVTKFGRLDILANVGAAWRLNFFMDTTEEDWDFEIAVVFRQVLNMCRATLEYMIERKAGKIINVASDAGRVGEPTQPVYSGAKGGVIAFTKALAKDVARHGILVNCVSPSFTLSGTLEIEKLLREAQGDELQRAQETMQRILRLYPLRKLGTPEDIASMVVFLASEQANHITGQTISVNGGYCML